MAVGAWSFYQKFRRNLGRGAITLQSGNWRMILLTSASNAATNTLSTYGSLTNELATSNGYTAGGGTKGLLTQTWTAGASAGQYRFNYSPARIWTATGGSIANIKFAVIYTSGASAGAKKLLVSSQLSTSQFTLTVGNTLTITASATGVFNLA